MTVLTIRAKGRFKLRTLLTEAMGVCQKYQHTEYIGDVNSLLIDLNHDDMVENGKPDGSVYAQTDPGGPDADLAVARKRIASLDDDGMNDGVEHS